MVPRISSQAESTAALEARIDLVLSSEELNQILTDGRLKLTVRATGDGAIRLRGSAARPDGSGVRVLSADLNVRGDLDRTFTLLRESPALADLEPDQGVRLRLVAATDNGGPTVHLHLSNT